MRDFFDDLEKAVRKVAADVSTEVTVAAREQKLKEAYQTLGRLHYQAVRAEKAPKGEKFQRQIHVIRELQEQIRDLRNNANVASDEDFEEP